MSTHIRKHQMEDGYRIFRAENYPRQEQLYHELGTLGQYPKVMVIGCADSRVNPTDIFHAHPGQIFVDRNVANIVPPKDKTGGFDSTSAAIEYAVTQLHVEMIIVMGHQSCGGVQGCLAGMGDNPEAGYVAKWVSLMNGARDRVLARGLPEDQLQYELELECVRESLKNLMTYPFIKTAVENHHLTLQGAYFSIVDAKLLMANADGVFEDVPIADPT